MRDSSCRDNIQVDSVHFIRENNPIVGSSNGEASIQRTANVKDDYTSLHGHGQCFDARSTEMLRQLMACVLRS